jgi:hypothetical protein
MEVPIENEIEKQVQKPLAPGGYGAGTRAGRKRIFQ